MTEVIHMADESEWQDIYAYAGENMVFVGQGSPWSHPKLYEDNNIERWYRWFLWQSDLIARLPELKDKVLVVDYPGNDTHAHRLVQLIERGITPASEHKLSNGRRFAALKLIKPYCLDRNGKENRHKRLWITTYLLKAESEDWPQGRAPLASFNDLTNADWECLRNWAYPGYHAGDWTVSGQFDFAAKKASQYYEEIKHD